jgi:ribosomal protein S18 acetylase RimI-like enzyme
MRIRKLTIDDYERVIDLWNRSGLPIEPRGRDSKKAITAQMAANPRFLLGAFQANQLVGTVIISSDTRRGWINRLAVDPDCRHRGIAKTLIAKSEKLLKKQGVIIFCVLIDDSNDASKELFKECGYRERKDIVYFRKHVTEES